MALVNKKEYERLEHNALCDIERLSAEWFNDEDKKAHGTIKAIEVILLELNANKIYKNGDHRRGFGTARREGD